jgi:hypothetical protein
MQYEYVFEKGKWETPEFKEMGMKKFDSHEEAIAYAIFIGAEYVWAGGSDEENCPPFSVWRKPGT